jgi:hypothetical protein
MSQTFISRGKERVREREREGKSVGKMMSVEILPLSPKSTISEINQIRSIGYSVCVGGGKEHVVKSRRVGERGKGEKFA